MPRIKQSSKSKSSKNKKQHVGGSLASDSVMGLVSCDAPVMRGGAETTCTVDAGDITDFVNLTPKSVPSDLPFVNPTSVNYGHAPASTIAVAAAPLPSFGDMNNTFITPHDVTPFSPPLLVGGSFHCKFCEKIMKALKGSPKSKASKPKKKATSKKSQKKPKV